MNAIISVVVSCLLNTSAPALPSQGVTSGQCSGSYIDKASGNVVGGWSMRVNLERNNKAPDGIQASKTAGRSMIKRGYNQNGFAELDVTTLRTITRAVALHSLSEADASGSQMLVF